MHMDAEVSDRSRLELGEDGECGKSMRRGASEASGCRGKRMDVKDLEERASGQAVRSENSEV